LKQIIKNNSKSTKILKDKFEKISHKGFNRKKKKLKYGIKKKEKRGPDLVGQP
jgi:hypothetical protein